MWNEIGINAYATGIFEGNLQLEMMVYQDVNLLQKTPGHIFAVMV